MTQKAEEVLHSAEEIAARTATWADLSNALFDPMSGLITKAYPTREERAVFLKSEEYTNIRDLISNTMERTGLVEGATPKKS